MSIGHVFSEAVDQEVAKLAELVKDKNKRYGNSYVGSADILRVLYPNGIKPEQYGNVLAIARVIDKLFRIAVGESDDVENWGDVTGYGLIMKIKAIFKEGKGK